MEKRGGPEIQPQKVANIRPLLGTCFSATGRDWSREQSGGPSAERGGAPPHRQSRCRPCCPSRREPAPPSRLRVCQQLPGCLEKPGRTRQPCSGPGVPPGTCCRPEGPQPREDPPRRGGRACGGTHGGVRWSRRPLRGHPRPPPGKEGMSSPGHTQRAAGVGAKRSREGGLGASRRKVGVPWHPELPTDWGSRREAICTPELVPEAARGQVQAEARAGARSSAPQRWGGSPAVGEAPGQAPCTLGQGAWTAQEGQRGGGAGSWSDSSCRRHGFLFSRCRRFNFPGFIASSPASLRR